MRGNRSTHTTSAAEPRLPRPHTVAVTRWPELVHTLGLGDQLGPDRLAMDLGRATL